MTEITEPGRRATRYDGTLEDRFWPKVDRAGSCWLWTAHRNRKGYGTINGGPEIGRPLLAHRVSWTIHNGPIPGDLYVLHRCDNPRCVNPDHLFLGTLADNNADMRNKGRASGGRLLGERANCSKLTPDQVIEMRKRFSLGQCPQAARAYGIAHQSAWQIITRRTWKHI